MTHHELPKEGQGWQAIHAAMGEARQGDLPWYGERIFRGGSYFSAPDVVEVANKAYQEYINYNALFGGWFPSLARYEKEVVGIVLDLMAAPEGAIGSTTSGGTESILMAVKTARDWARDHLPKATAPEMVLPRAAHPAFDKAGHMMGIEVRRMATSVDYRADLDAMADAIDHNTIMMVGSAPSYPYGISDPIAEIAAMAAAHGLWMHVDACNGGCVFPFARKLGYQFPDYDFSVPAVTSISVDVHKLGYANKGVSILLFRDAALEAYQRYTLEDWPSGTYSTANITGSRSAGGIASAWAVMSYLGEEGYLKIVGTILEARDRVVSGIRAIDGLQVRGEPHAYILTFGSDDFDIFAVAEGMEVRGWLSGHGLEPDSIHLFLNGAHAPAIQGYLADLATVVEQVKAGRIVSKGVRTAYTT